MARAAAVLALAMLGCMGVASGAALRNSSLPSQTVSAKKAPATSLNATASKGAPTVQRFMEVKVGPFATDAEACDYCFSSFTKQGQPPAGPVAPACVCMAYPDSGKFNMFCATPVSAAGYVAEKKGCRCKPRDMEAMGKTTCEPI